MTNILNFPTNKSGKKTRPANTNNVKADRARMKENKTIFVDRLTEHYGTQLISKLAMHGFDIDSDDFMYDYIFSMETLRACLLRNIGVSHPLQKLSDKANELLDDEE